MEGVNVGEWRVNVKWVAPGLSVVFVSAVPCRLDAPCRAGECHTIIIRQHIVNTADHSLAAD